MTAGHLSEAIRARLNMVISKIELPNANKGYKYLGCWIKWREESRTKEILEATDVVLEKVKKYTFKLGNLRNDCKITLFAAYVEQ